MPRTKKNGFSISWTEKGESAIRVGKGLFEDGNGVFVDTLREISGKKDPKVFLVADANVVQKTDQLGVKIGRMLSSAGIEIAGSPMILPGGERVKNDDFATVGRISKAVFDARLSTDDCIVAIGGGTVIDVAGFAAAEVRGGMKFAIVPTTPLAAVESTFMTSAAVDNYGVKDAMMVRSAPSAAFVDPDFSATILDGVWRGGLGALTRYAAARDGSLFKRIVSEKDALKSRDMEAFSSILESAVVSKAKKGGTDLGLWAAHRLESMSGFKLPHGYAVPMGVCIDCAYGVKSGVLSEEDAGAICSLFEDFGALEGFAHSHHILGRVHIILRGIDTWRLSGHSSHEIPSAPGKTVKVEKPERGIYGAVLDELVAEIMKSSNKEQDGGSPDAAPEEHGKEDENEND